MAHDDKHTRYAAAVAAELNDERERQEVGYRELERRTGINMGTLNRYFSGSRTLPVSTLYTLSEALGVDALTIAGRAQKRMK